MILSDFSIFQISHNSLNRLKQLLQNVESGGKFANVLDESACQNLDLEIRYEEALLLWDWEEKDHANRQLKSLLHILNKQQEQEQQQQTTKRSVKLYQNQ